MLQKKLKTIIPTALSAIAIFAIILLSMHEAKINAFHSSLQDTYYKESQTGTLDFNLPVTFTKNTISYNDTTYIIQQKKLTQENFPPPFDYRYQNVYILKTKSGPTFQLIFHNGKDASVFHLAIISEDTPQALGSYSKDWTT